MLPYEITSPAEEDLKEIARYTQTHWGKKQSLHYAGLLEKCFQDIAPGTAQSHSFSERYPQIRVRSANTTIFSISILKKSRPTLLLFCMNGWIC